MSLVSTPLAETDRQRDRFIATLFHELRNPLATAQCWLLVLRRTSQGGPQAERAIDAIDRQLVLLARLVEDLLDVSRIREGKMRLETTRLDLAQLARRVVDDHRPMFSAKGVELRAEIPAGPLWVHGDAARLAQVMGNLLQNAAKFTPRAGRAVLAAETDAEARTAIVRLRDTGAGFDPALGERLFQPFEQAEPTIARSEGGLGLGLALVKELVELHGGTVEARSDGPDAGAEFVVCLPLAPAAREEG
jgi:signal transduction histidine kinase